MTAARIVVPSYSGAASVLVATPDIALRKRLGGSLRQVTTVEDASTGAEALSLLERRGARIVVLDRKLPDLHCDELVSVVERQFPWINVILLNSENGEIELPEELREDAIYRCLYEFNLSQQRTTAAQPTVSQPAPSAFMPLPGIVGTSEPMQQLAALVRAVAPHTTSVLVTGETGAGKELVAEAIHELSPRAGKPFVTVNCAAIPETLIEAELFGHTRGAFTGAVQSRLGKIHAAQGGSIFFDEIGELPLGSQAKLLRFLESGEVQRLGTSDVFRLDARVIAATNVDLEQRVEQRLFREDLFFRLSVFPIELPPLRERAADIVSLARHFLQRFSGNTITLSPESEAKLTAHLWPGNVRELRNVIERAFILSAGHGTIAPEQIMLRKPRASTRSSSESS